MNRITLYDFIIDEIKGGTHYNRYYSDSDCSEEECKEDENVSKNINDNKEKNINDEYKYDFYKFLDHIFKANSIPDNALDHMLNVPFFFEKLMSFSFLLCLDNILYDITFMPIQVVRSICLLISLFFKNASRNIMNIFYNFKNYKFYKYAVNNYKDPKKKYKVRVIKNLNKLSYIKRKENDHMYESKYIKEKSLDESSILYKKLSRNLFSFHYLNGSRFSMNASHSDDIWVDTHLEKRININNNNNNEEEFNKSVEKQENDEHKNNICDNITCSMKKKNIGKYFLYNRKRKMSSYNKDLKSELLKYGHKYSVLKSREDVKLLRSKSIMLNCVNNNNDDDEEKGERKKYINNIKYLKNEIKLNYYFKYKGNMINDTYYSDNIYDMEKENWTKHKKNKKKINEIYNTTKKEKKNFFIHFFIILFCFGKNILQNIKYLMNYIFIKIVYFFHIHKLYTFPIYKDERKKKKMYTQSFEMNFHNTRNKQMVDFSDIHNRRGLLKIDYEQGGEIHRLNSVHFEDNEEHISSNLFIKHMYKSNEVDMGKCVNMSNKEKTKQNNKNMRNLLMCAKRVIGRNNKLCASKNDHIDTNKGENYSNEFVDNKFEASCELYGKDKDTKMNDPNNNMDNNMENNNDNNNDNHIIMSDVMNNASYCTTEKHNNCDLLNMKANDNMFNACSHNNDDDKIIKKGCHDLKYKKDNQNCNSFMVNEKNDDKFINDTNKCNPFLVKSFYKDEKYKKSNDDFTKLNENNKKDSKNMKNKKNINNLQNMNKIKDMKKKLFKEHLNSLKLSFPEYSGIIRLSLILICIYIFSFVDTSRIYHYIRAQPFMKLYVVLNMLEILERLLRSLGKDLIDNMIRTFIRIINLRSYICIIRNNYNEKSSINSNSNYINYVHNDNYGVNSYIYKNEDNNNELITFDNTRHINVFTNKNKDNLLNNNNNNMNYMNYMYKDSVIKNKHEYENGYVTNMDKDIFSNNFYMNNIRHHADSFYYQNELNSFNLNKNKENNVRFFNNENDKKKNNKSKISILFPFYSVVLKFTIQYIFVLAYILIHAFMHLVRFLSLNIAINSSESTMFLILVMSNFTEIKSTVFKKFTKISLFTIVASDAVERFYLFIDAFLVLLKMSTAYRTQNSFFSISSWLIIILLLEVGVDWCKHSYLLKYNKLDSESLNKYFHTLLADVLISRTPNKNIYYMKDSFAVPCKNIFSFSHIPTRRLGYMSMPVVTLIVCSLPRLNYLSNISLFSFALSIWICLFLFKIILSIMIVSYTISEKKQLKNLKKPYDDISAL
ncbi:hypothetical protein PFMG_03035 [Plasmodium falciparum IGH-CR14]|uniref:Cyclic amine resistance locus protein n=1 Tax=Plasmodium falciparum IGH-CR14 TaxID=580059 RepID=A0A0L1ICC9_PLAFA|nr:hypothetical protein PFMG_03035 [Plasmodium falciparum IGH-CR14]